MRERGRYKLLADPVKHVLYCMRLAICASYGTSGLVTWVLHYGALPLLKKIVRGLPNFKVKKIGVCKSCALGKHANSAFLSSEHRLRENLDLIH